jgi:hypothetical protein
MTHTSSQSDFPCRISDKAPVRQTTAERAVGVLRHLFDAAFEWGETDDDREIAGFLARSGGRLTDNIEREMMRRRTESNWTNRG